VKTAVHVFLIITTVLFFGQQANAQSDWRLSVPIRIEGGGNFAKMELDSGVTWRQGLGAALTLGSGIGFRYKDRLGGSIEAGVLIDHYDFGNGPVEYTYALFVTQARANLHYLIPKKNAKDWFYRIDFDAGYTAVNGDDRISEDLGTQVVETVSLGPGRWFIAPGFGMAELTKRGHLSAVITYNYHFGSGGTTLTTFTKEGTGQSKATGKADYLGIRFRMMLDVKGHKPFGTPSVAPPEEFFAFSKRDTRVKKKFTSKRSRVVLKLYDNADIDGDTISVAVNGKYVLTDYALTKKKKKIKIQLESGQNDVVIYAHNEGRISPNTAACEFRSGWRRERFVISTGLDRNESILIEY
jgi:hypothetical protein